MSEHEDILAVVPGTIKIDETAGVQPEDDEILVSAGASILAVNDLYLAYGEPANLSWKADMITTPEGVTDIGWAVNEAGDPVVNVDSGLTALDPDSGNYEAVMLNTDPTDDNILIGTTATGGNVAFIAVIVEGEDGLSHDVYLLDYLPKEHPDGTPATGVDDTVTLDGLFVNVTVSETVEFDFAGAPAGNNDFMAFGESGPDGVAIVVTGRTVGETVNSSQANITSLGAGSQNIDPGEGLVITYVTGMDPDFLVPDLSATEAKDAGNIQFGALQTATEASVTLVKFTPPHAESTVRITALLTDQEEGNAFIPGITNDSDPEVLITAVFVNDVAWAFTLDGNTAVIEGVTNDDTITFQTDGVHNRVIVENGQPLSGSGSNVSWNIGGVAISDVNTLADADPISLAFDDDAPAVGANDAVQLDDDALTGGNPGGVGDVAPDTANTSGTLAHDFGADGAGSIEWLTTGAPAGFSYALNASDDLEISQGGEVKLTLTVDATTGAYTVTQNNPIDHAAGDDENNQAFTVAYRVTDGDTDFVDGSIAIDVDDDTPTVAPSGDPAPPLEVDESDFATDDTQSFAGLFSVSFGADGPGAGGGTSYALSVTDPSSGVTDTLTGQPVTLALEGADIVGRNDDLDEVFRVSVDGVGNVTLDQSRAVVHPDDTDPDDLITLAAGKIGLTATATDGDADSAELTVDISTSMGFRDDGPTIAVGDAVGTYAEPAEATGTFVDDAGADGPADLSITFDSYQIDAHDPVSTSDPGANVTFVESLTDTTWTGTITDDFNGDGLAETVEFTLGVDLATDEYTVTLDTPPAQKVVLSTANGSLDAGGPDPVRTLTLVDSSEVVFSAVDPTTAPGLISGFLNASEADIEAGAGYLSDDEMNVSTAGIGNGNNNFDGNALSGIDGAVTQGGKVDESFVVDPTDFDVSSVKVYIDNSVGGYDNPPEELYYLAYDAAGNAVGTPTLVTDADLSTEAGGQVSFTIGDPEGPNNIDAVQLFMGRGTIKIPVIEFTTSEAFDPDSLTMNFTATREDGDVDTATDTFTVDFVDTLI